MADSVNDLRAKTGTTYEALPGIVVAATTTSSTTVSASTSLPSSPSDGQQAILVDSTSAPTYSWMLQWSAAASKWLFVGGSAAVSVVDTSETVNSASYIDLATVGPSFTAPRAGTYLLSYGAVFSPPSGSATLQSYVAPKIGAAATSDNDAATFKGSDVGTQSALQNVTRSRRFTAAASDLLKLQYRGASAVAGHTAQARWLSVLPVTLT